MIKEQPRKQTPSGRVSKITHGFQQPENSGLQTHIYTHSRSGTGIFEVDPCGLHLLPHLLAGIGAPVRLAAGSGVDEDVPVGNASKGHVQLRLWVLGLDHACGAHHYFYYKSLFIQSIRLLVSELNCPKYMLILMHGGWHRTGASVKHGCQVNFSATYACIVAHGPHPGSPKE